MNTTENKTAQSLTGGLEPPRFSLRHLFGLIALVAVTIVMFLRYDPIAVLPVLLGAVLIGLHVVGNAVGTRLRSSTVRDSDQVLQLRRESRASELGRPIFAPPTRLSHKSSLGWPLLLATCLGIAVGGATGYWTMNHLYGSRLEAGAITVGMIAAMSLGGFWFFWCWSLVQVGLSAWWHAHSSSTHDNNRHTAGRT